MVSFADIKHGFDPNTKRNTFHLRLDMKLFCFSVDQALKCFKLFQSEVTEPLSEHCIMHCSGVDGRMINPKKVFEMAEKYYAGRDGCLGSMCGVSFDGRVKTDAIRSKKDLNAYVREQILDGHYTNKSAISCYYDIALNKLMAIPQIPDFNTASEAEKQDFFDAAYAYVNTDKYPVGNIGHDWETEGLITFAEMLDTASGRLDSLGDIKIWAAFPCVENDLYGFYELFKLLALRIHEIIPCSYGAVELGGPWDENYEGCYYIRTDSAISKFDDLQNNYHYLGSYNIITEKMAESIKPYEGTAVLFKKLAGSGAIIEAVEEPFKISSLTRIRSILEPILGSGRIETISNAFSSPMILPVPRDNFRELENNGNTIPTIIKECTYQSGIVRDEARAGLY